MAVRAVCHACASGQCFEGQFCCISLLWSCTSFYVRRRMAASRLLRPWRGRPTEPPGRGRQAVVRGPLPTRRFQSAHNCQQLTSFCVFLGCFCGVGRACAGGPPRPSNCQPEWATLFRRKCRRARHGGQPQHTAVKQATRAERCQAARRCISSRAFVSGITCQTGWPTGW